MDLLLNILSVGVILIYLLLSILLKNVLKRDSYLSSCFDISLMMLGFYWESKGMIFLLISSCVCLCIFFCVYYFSIYKELKLKNETTIAPKNKALVCLSTLLFVIPMFVESSIIMVSLLVMFVITDRALFYRKFKSLF